ncbi:MAG: hypothetical protein LUG99_17005 [Lachnospiraceae bacterium]|nr:hypothetical protein [Lachnospiraceae bacterium]
MRKKTEKNEKEFIDDGRTIADMSGVEMPPRGALRQVALPMKVRCAKGKAVERPGMFGHLPESWKRGGPASDAGRRGNGRYASDSDIRTNDPMQNPPITRKERRIYTRAAVKAGLLIGLVYIVGCSIVIGILYLAWVVF